MRTKTKTKDSDKFNFDLKMAIITFHPENEYLYSMLIYPKDISFKVIKLNLMVELKPEDHPCQWDPSSGHQWYLYPISTHQIAVKMLNWKTTIVIYRTTPQTRLKALFFKKTVTVRRKGVLRQRELWWKSICLNPHWFSGDLMTKATSKWATEGTKRLLFYDGYSLWYLQWSSLYQGI